MFGLWDATTTGGAGICHGLALWGASEMMGLAALVVTIVGVILAIRSLHETQKSSADAANSARKLLENEQSADLVIPYRAVDPHEEDTEEAPVWIASYSDPPTSLFLRGWLQNAGRYGARDIKLAAFLNDKRLESNRHPVADDYIEPSGDCEFMLALPDGDEETRPDGRCNSLVIEVRYSDGNVRDPSKSKKRTWRFDFPNRPLQFGDKARGVSVIDDLVLNPHARTVAQGRNES